MNLPMFNVFYPKIRLRKFITEKIILGKIELTIFIVSLIVNPNYYIHEPL